MLRRERKYYGPRPGAEVGIEDGRGYVVGYRIAEKMGNAKGKLPEKGRPSVMGPVINAREQLTRVPSFSQ